MTWFPGHGGQTAQLPCTPGVAGSCKAFKQGVAVPVQPSGGRAREARRHRSHKVVEMRSPRKLRLPQPYQVRGGSLPSTQSLTCMCVRVQGPQHPPMHTCSDTMAQRPGSPLCTANKGTVITGRGSGQIKGYKISTSVAIKG